jgi:hypothetical protein
VARDPGSGAGPGQWRGTRAVAGDPGSGADPGTPADPGGGAGPGRRTNLSTRGPGEAQIWIPTGTGLAPAKKKNHTTNAANVSPALTTSTASST